MRFPKLDALNRSDLIKPFRGILRLSVGDFFAKTLNFLAVVYLARVLGVSGYGVLEFALSILTYFILIADGGLELWATREAARGADTRELTSRVLPLRMLLAALAFAVLLLVLAALPDFPALKTLMVLFGLTLFVQAASVKWAFMGREKMSHVAAGLVVTQAVFAAPLFFFVRDPEHIIWVPVARLAGESIAAGYFWLLLKRDYGAIGLSLTLRGARDLLRPAFTMNAAHGLAMVSYNFDSVMLGFFLGATAVGWYNAAYKPVTVVLAMPVTYFLGLFPALSRTYAETRERFREVVVSSIRLTAIFALPIGVGGVFLAAPVIGLLFGSAYANAVPVLQVLAWSAVLVILRGTFRQALNAAGRQGLDLRCAATATALNVGANLVLIPRYGIIGAAAATVLSEIVWLTMACYYFHRHVAPLKLHAYLIQPIAGATAMGAYFVLVPSLFWVAQAVIGLVVYFGVLLLLGNLEVQGWFQARKA